MIHDAYLDLTAEFHRGGRRVLLRSGQAVVLHRLAVMRKDGDWIVREDAAAIDHVRHVLQRHGATCRFGAPLDPRWLAGGWSAHLEYRGDGVRIRAEHAGSHVSAAQPRPTSPSAEAFSRKSPNQASHPHRPCHPTTTLATMFAPRVPQPDPFALAQDSPTADTDPTADRPTP